MRIARNDVPVKIDVPGAVARRQRGFGEATGYGAMAGEHFSLGAGTDIAPLLRGLRDDRGHAPHRGYVLVGELTVTYTDGAREEVRGGDLFSRPPGHSVKVGEDAEVILFSPAREHAEVMEHMLRKIRGAG